MMGKTAPVRSSNRVTMADFAGSLGGSLNLSLGNPLGTPNPRVVDKTGLAGLYQFRLEFEGNVPAPPGNADAIEPGSGGQNLFNALEKQLGLRLLRSKGVPVDVVVIDKIDRTPVAN